MMEPPANRTEDGISVVYIEDDVRTACLMAKYLESHGLSITLAEDGATGITAVMRGDPDVVLLDLMMPGADGIEVCRQLRSRTGVPIIMVSARTEEADRVMGLEGGADDYLVKPFSSRELLARIRAHVRRARGRAGPPIERLRVGGLVLDPRAMSATIHGEGLALTTYEFMLLRALAESAGRVMTREQLVEIVRGSADETFERAIDVHISRLRQKLNDDPRHPRMLKTVRRRGYMLALEQE
ncbi:response regulator transcription factor [Pendulispora brunnea]|uniref:Response regulator transcription factor n=1 Tax=Pendulispora brunnea TaxID=2905690 RepID=A0ABZ2JY74_9BACT